MKQSYKSLVLKLGSEVFKQNGGINEGVFATVASQIALLCREGIKITVVSSFAIRLGELWLKQHGFGANLVCPVLAAIGQSKLMARWDAALLKEGLAAAQVLISDASLMHRDEWENAGSTIGICHAHSVIPVINANDPVSWNESQRYKARTSDNDFVTAQLVPHIDATDVLFITNVAGVYAGLPHHPDARRYAEISADNPPHIEPYSAGDSNGGMGPKVKYAIECYDGGKRRVAITGLTDDVIVRFARGQDVPTMIGTRNVLC